LNKQVTTHWKFASLHISTIHFKPLSTCRNILVIYIICCDCCFSCIYFFASYIPCQETSNTGHDSIGPRSREHLDPRHSNIYCIWRRRNMPCYEASRQIIVVASDLGWTWMLLYLPVFVHRSLVVTLLNPKTSTACGYSASEGTRQVRCSSSPMKMLAHARGSRTETKTLKP